ncbi:MAG: hypothetical protein ABL963_04940 [Longimicrobiales bacterium]
MANLDIIRFGRVVSIFGVVGTTAVLVALSAMPEQPAGREMRLLDWIAALVLFSMLVGWASAIIHWRRHYPFGVRKALWGLAILFGIVFGAVAYWYWGAPQTPPTRPPSR